MNKTLKLIPSEIFRDKIFDYSFFSGIAISLALSLTYFFNNLPMSPIFNGHPILGIIGNFIFSVIISFILASMMLENNYEGKDTSGNDKKINYYRVISINLLLIACNSLFFYIIAEAFYWLHVA